MYAFAFKETLPTPLPSSKSEAFSCLNSFNYCPQSNFQSLSLLKPDTGLSCHLCWPHLPSPCPARGPLVPCGGRGRPPSFCWAHPHMPGSMCPCVSCPARPHRLLRPLSWEDPPAQDSGPFAVAVPGHGVRIPASSSGRVFMSPSEWLEGWGPGLPAALVGHPRCSGMRHGCEKARGQSPGQPAVLAVGLGRGCLLIPSLQLHFGWLWPLIETGWGKETWDSTVLPILRTFYLCCGICHLSGGRATPRLSLSRERYSFSFHWDFLIPLWFLLFVVFYRQGVWSWGRTSVVLSDLRRPLISLYKIRVQLASPCPFGAKIVM